MQLNLYNTAINGIINQKFDLSFRSFLETRPFQKRKKNLNQL